MKELSGKIETVADLGKIVRNRRKTDRLTQADMAALCEVGTRFLSELENGKPTVQFGKAIKVLNSLGLEVHVVPRGWPPTPVDLP